MKYKFELSYSDGRTHEHEVDERNAISAWMEITDYARGFVKGPDNTKLRGISLVWEEPNAFEPIVFNSGGGIWICEMNLGDGTYAVIDSESIVCDMECLSIYNDAEEPFMPEDMFFSENLEDLDTMHKALYMQMKKALIKEMENFGYSL